jgi:hypothetical protein
VSFWQSLAELPLYDWARLHPFVTAAIEGAHLASSAFFFGAIVLLDLRVLGFGRRLVVASLARLTLTSCLVAFVFVTLTGLFMFGMSAPRWVNTPEFVWKVALIALGGVNAAALHFTTWRRVDVWGAVTARAPRAAKAFVVASLAIWLAVTVLGRYQGYTTPDRFMSDDELELLQQPGGPLDIF